MRGKVTFTGGGGTFVATTDSAGRYKASLPPGHYTVEGTSPDWAGSCTGPELVVGDSSVERDVICAID
jgi:hypothetical protein